MTIYLASRRDERGLSIRGDQWEDDVSLLPIELPKAKSGRSRDPLRIPLGEIVVALQIGYAWRRLPNKPRGSFGSVRLAPLGTSQLAGGDNSSR